MTSIRRPDGGDHTAPEDTATKWPPCVGMGGRDASESVAAIIGMRSHVDELESNKHIERCAGPEGGSCQPVAAFLSRVVFHDFHSRRILRPAATTR